MPRLKVSRELSRLVLRDIASFAGMKFKYPDRLTRAETTALANWAATHPQVQAALRDTRDPAHAGVTLYRQVIAHFATDHPADASGAPRAWPDKTPTGRTPTADNPYLDLDAEEAEARLIYHSVQPEYRAAINDPQHPDHAELVRQIGLMNQIRVGEIAEPAAPPSRAATEALAAIEALKTDKAFQAALHDTSHYDHKRALERRSALYETAYRDSGGSSPPAGAPAPIDPAAAARDEIQRLARDPEFQSVYRDVSHGDRHAAKERLAGLYAEAYPEPPAPADTGATP